MMMVMMKHAPKNKYPPLLLLLLLLPAALAQPAGQTSALSRFLEPVASHPGLQASAAAVTVAEAQLAAAHDPFALSVTAGYSAFSYEDPPTLPPGLPPAQAAALSQLPDSATQISADLTLRPFAFGDIRDLTEQRQVELQLARLDHAELQVSLEVQAITAALQLRLAEESLALAQQGDALARRALAATRTRFERGAANQRELRDAETGATEAAHFVLNAEAGLQLARLGLANLIGSSVAPEAEDLQVGRPAGTPLSVQRAQLRAQLAETGMNNAKRSVLPVAQLGYTLNLDNQNSVGITLESRTLQPNLNYTHQKPGSQFPQDQLKGSFQIGVSASISPSVGTALRAADTQLAAALSALQAATQAAELELAALANDLARSIRELELAELQAHNARLTLEETRAREELGLSIPLETQSAVLEQLQAELDLQSARQQQLTSTLAFYPFYGIPLVTLPEVH
jgi:outer membrane protein TolC